MFVLFSPRSCAQFLFSVSCVSAWRVCVMVNHLPKVFYWWWLLLLLAFIFIFFIFIIITITIIIVFIIVVNIIIIQGKDDTKLNKEISGWSRAGRSFFLKVSFYRRGGAVGFSRYAVVGLSTFVKPPCKRQPLNSKSDSIFIFFIILIVIIYCFPFDQISWSVYFLLPQFGS